MIAASKNSRAISKMVSIGIVIAILIIGVAGLLCVSTARSSTSSGSGISCSNTPNSSAVQVSITPGASNSANAPGYSPDAISLVIGTNNTVTWTNNDSAHHTVTTSSAPADTSFNSGDMAPKATYTCTFTTSGTYKYYCTYHSWMTGTIIVAAV